MTVSGFVLIFGCSARTWALVGASRQSKRRSTVKGRITFQMRYQWSEIGLRRAKSSLARRRVTQGPRSELKVLPGVRLLPRGAQQVGRMVADHQGDALLPQVMQTPA